MTDQALVPADPKPIEAKDKTVYPVYSWQHGKTFFLSKTDTIVAETFLATMDYEECQRRVKEEVKRDVTVHTIKLWLEDPKVKDWIAEKFREKGIANSWTKEKWIAVMTDHVRGEKRLAAGDMYCMKLIAGVMGWDMPQGMMQTNVSINFTQADGKE